MTPELWAFVKENLSPAFVMFGLAWLIHRKILVLGRELAASEKREAYWQAIAERATGMLDTSISREERRLDRHSDQRGTER